MTAVYQINDYPTDLGEAVPSAGFSPPASKDRIQMPSEFYEMTPEQIKVLCEMDKSTPFKTMPSWDSMV